MSVVLDGTRPLWHDMHDYLMFLTAHQDEIHEHYMMGEENAEFIVELIATIKGGYPKSIVH